MTEIDAVAGRRFSERVVLNDLNCINLQRIRQTSAHAPAQTTRPLQSCPIATLPSAYSRINLQILSGHIAIVARHAPESGAGYQEINGGICETPDVYPQSNWGRPFLAHSLRGVGALARTAQHEEVIVRLSRCISGLL